MNIIPVSAKPSQIINVTLSNQATTLRIYQKFFGLYIDVLVNDVLIIGGVVCRDRNLTVRSDYLQFVGDLSFFDTQGRKDPEYTDIGNRWQLGYFFDQEISQFGLT